MRKTQIIAGLLGATVLAAACSTIPRPGPVGNPSVPEPAKSVDLKRYMGRWYEQFRYEASFQKGMERVSADYSMQDDGSVKVVNRGHKGSVEGVEKQSVGKAKVVDTNTNAKLKVSFFGPFYGEYWILDHGDNYEWSIVGEPSGRYLWGLTRDANPGPDLLATMQARVRSMGYDWSMVRVTKQ